MFVVKIGGSLITNKDAYCSPDKVKIKEFAKLIKENWSILKGNLILVLGGGSYGNGVPIRYNIADSQQEWDEKNLLMMTTKMFEWMNEVCQIFREEGIPCYPFQTSSYCTTNKGNLNTCNIEPIKHCLNLGILPITSGDLTFDNNKKFVIYSSDNVPEMFIKRLNVKKVVILTDVEGIYEDLKTKKLIKEVTPQNYSDILNMAGNSQKQDVTGGMNNKLKALLRISQEGATSIICNGKDTQNLFRALYDDTPPGTVIKKWNMVGED